jgi:ribonuclease HI
VDDFKFPIYKKFPSLEEAEQFIKDRGASTAGSSGQSNKSLRGQKTAVPAAPVISVRSLTTVAYGNSNFHRDDDGYVHCYTDGSCEGNGQAKARAGIGVWFGVDHPM